MMHRQLTIVLGLIEKDGKYLITRRVDPDHPQWHQKWEIPGGKINPGETPLQALHREMHEETQLTIHSPHLIGVHTHHWNTPSGVQQTFMLVYHCQTKDDEVVLCPEENDAFSWSTVEQMLQLENLLEGTVDMLNSILLQPDPYAPVVY